MKILFLTQYFPPEVGAPQNRLFELAVRLKNKGADLSILTAMPHYPQMEIHAGYQGNKIKFETIEGLKIVRTSIYVTKSKSIFARLLNYFSFVFTSFWAGWWRTGTFDYILCESPPLFLGISAYLLCKIKGAKLIFNVSDLWPESAEKLNLVSNPLLLKMAYGLEKFLYHHSSIITCQTQGIVKNISARYPSTKTYWLPNGVDLSYYHYAQAPAHWRVKHNFSEDDFLLLYAGIIGHAQGLEVILKAAQLSKNIPSIKYLLVGDGPEKEKLVEIKRELGLHNVFFYSTVSKKEMPEILQSINASIIPLKKLDLFKGAIPSKTFEVMAMKKPILLGVEGEAKELFIDAGKAGLAFMPEDSQDLYDKILVLYQSNEQANQLGENGYHYVKENFSRDLIATNFWNFIQTTH
jgi:glycosyltransferase involved in cell wall biosynthesis